jgi:hypothetical protein
MTSIGTLQATLGTNFTYTFAKSSFSSSVVNLVVVLGNTSSWLNFDETSFTLSGHVPSNLEPQEDQLVLIASEGSQSQSQSFHITLASASTTAIHASASMGNSVPTSASSVGPGGLLISGQDGTANSESNGKAIVGAVIGSVLGVSTILCILLRLRRKKQKRDREGYLGADRPKISGPTLQQQDRWSEEAEIPGRSMYTNRVVSPIPPRIEIAYDTSTTVKRQSRLSKHGSWDFLRSSPFSSSLADLNRFRDKPLPQLVTMDEESAPLRGEEAVSPFQGRSNPYRMASRIMDSSSLGPASQPGDPYQSQPKRTSYRISGYGHGTGINRKPPSRKGSRQFRQSSRVSSNFGFGHGRKASFDRLSSVGPPTFDKVRVSWRNTAASSDDYMSTGSFSTFSRAQSNDRLHYFPQPPVPDFYGYSDPIPEDTVVYSRPTIRAVTSPAQVYTPTRAYQFQKFNKERRRSQRESILFSAKPSSSSRNSSLKPYLSPHPESSAEDHPQSGSSDSSNKENNYHRSSGIDKLAPGYRKGLMIHSVTSASPVTSALSPLPSSQCLPSHPFASFRRPGVRNSPKLTSRFSNPLGLARFGGSKSSLTSSQRFGSAHESDNGDGEDLIEEVEDETGSGRVWMHADVPNPLALHGTEGRMSRLSLSRKGGRGDSAMGGPRIVLGGRGKRVSVEEGALKRGGEFGGSRRGEMAFL